MQTFLPYPNFGDTARCLDDKRLGNQAYREGLTLLRGKWPNHPASKMWRGHEDVLARYVLQLLEELSRRGRHYPHHFTEAERYLSVGSLDDPPWLGDERLHASHRSNLLRKDPAWYGRFGWSEPDDMPYYWPI